MSENELSLAGNGNSINVMGFVKLMAATIMKVPFVD